MQTTRSARPMGAHDTTGLRRDERGERRAFWYLAAVCVALIGYVATNAPMLARLVFA